MHIILNKYQLNIFTSGNNKVVFDPIRKKHVAFTPEEMVRQYVIQYLIKEKKVPSSLISIEMNISINQVKKRCDLVVFDRNGKALVIIECKAPTVALNENVFEQIARYNLALEVPYLIITNGESAYCSHLDTNDNFYKLVEDIPPYAEL